MQYYVKLTLVAGMILVGGVVQGRFSDRWGPPQDSLVAAKKLRSLPLEFGPWRREKVERLTPATLRMLQCTGYHHADYINEQTSELVKVAIVLGPSGPISVHTPEICYPAHDYKILDARREQEIAGHQFWSLDLQSKGLDAHRLRVYYAWGTGGVWEAATQPRVTFATRKFLYKIQVASLSGPEGSDEDKDAGRRFLEEFVGAAQSCLAK